MRKLTETKIRHAKPTNKDQWLSDGAGLYLRIRKSGSRNWVIRRMQNGRNQVITLGTYPETSLKQARLLAARYQLKQEVHGITVADLVERYLQEVVEPTHKRAELPKGYMDRAVLPVMAGARFRMLRGRSAWHSSRIMQRTTDAMVSLLPGLLNSYART